MLVNLHSVQDLKNHAAPKNSKEQTHAPANNTVVSEIPKNMRASTFGIAFKAGPLGQAIDTNPLDPLVELLQQPKDSRTVAKIKKTITAIFEGKIPGIRKRDRSAISSTIDNSLSRKEARPFVHLAAPLTGPEMPGLTRYEALELFKNKGGPEHVKFLLPHLNPDRGVVMVSDDVKPWKGDVYRDNHNRLVRVKPQKGGVEYKEDANSAIIRSMAIQAIGNIASKNQVVTIGPKDKKSQEFFEPIAIADENGNKTNEKGEMRIPVVELMEDIAKDQNDKTKKIPAILECSNTDDGQIKAIKRNAAEAARKIRESEQVEQPIEDTLGMDNLGRDEIKKLIQLQKFSKKHGGDLTHPEVAPLAKEIKDIGEEKVKVLENNGANIKPQEGSKDKVDVNALLVDLEVNQVRGVKSYEVKAPEVTVEAENNVDVYKDGSAYEITADTVIMHGKEGRKGKIEGGTVDVIRANNADILGGKVDTVYAGEKVRIEDGTVNNIEFTGKPGTLQLLDREASVQGKIKNCAKIIVPLGTKSSKSWKKMEEDLRAKSTNDVEIVNAETPTRNSALSIHH